ncbi:MAG TPA: DUF6779 domain-containing protein, partial [Jatrophihabitantaceae bacterium]
MSAPAERPQGRGALRTTGMLAAIALGGVAVFMVVVGHTQKQVQLGLLVGLWGVLLGAFTLFGPRRGSTELSGEPMLTSHERAPARRREDELQLEVKVRREMERVLHQELSELRGEVAGLRSDLVEKVKGQQLHLERIETTRVISADLEELQHEVRRLAVGRGAAGAIEGAPGAPAFSPATVVESRVKNSAPLPYVYAGRDRSGPAVGGTPPKPAPPTPASASSASSAGARPASPAASAVPPVMSDPRPAPSPQPAPSPSFPGPNFAGPNLPAGRPVSPPSPPSAPRPPVAPLPRSTPRPAASQAQ